MALAIASVGTLGNAKTGTTFAPPAPAGVASGSLVIVAVMGYATTLTTAPTIDNFIAGPVSVSAMNAFTFQFKVWWFYKYATGADTGNYAGHMASGNAMMAYAFRVSGWTPTSGSPFADSLHEGSADGAATTIASWTPGGANSLLAMIMLDSGANYPPSWTKNINATDLDGDTITLASTVQTTAAATGALTVGNIDGTIASVATLRIPFAGANYTANPADNAGLTDVASRAVAAARTAADPEGITDAAATQTDLARTSTDPLGLTDAASTAQATVRALADTSGLTDAVAATQNAVRSTADAASITDTASTAIDSDREPGDPVGLTDTVSVVVTSSGTATPDDPLGITDDAGAVLVMLRALVDGLGLTDEVIAVLTGADDEVLTDPVGMTDGVTLLADTARGVLEPVGIADSVTATLTSADTALVTNELGLTDAVTAVLNGIQRDLTLTTKPLPDRWATTPAGPRWETAPLDTRWSTTPSGARWSTAPTPDRWETTCLQQ